MNYNNLIGFPLDYAEDYLKKNNVVYEIIYNSEYKKNFDTYLIVNTIQKDGVVQLIVDRFLIKI